VIEEQATVLRADARVAYVQAERRSTCGSCSAASGCGTSLLDRFLGRRVPRLEVDNDLGVSAGDLVVIGVPEGAMLRAAAAAYLGPLAGLILGAVAGRHWPFAAGGSEAMSLLGAALCFGGALWLVARYSRALSRDPRFRPVLLRRHAGTSVHVSLG
jgi:sigma-E factor negative regulatory protein RseC